jgi:hypothetical protein
LSNTSTKAQLPGPSPWIEWPWPRGKYQTSPGPKSTIFHCPSGLIVVTRQLPSMT